MRSRPGGVRRSVVPVIMGLAALLGLSAAALWAGPPGDGAADARVAVPAEVVAEGLSEADWSLLQSGAAVVKDKSGKAEAGGPARVAAFVLVEAPWTAAYGFLSHPERQAEYSRCTKAVEIVAREQRDGIQTIKSRERHKALWMSMRYTLDYVQDPAAREIRWTLDPAAKNDVSDNRGSWRIVELGPRLSLVAYRIAGLPGKLPGFLIDYCVKRDLPSYMRAMRDRVESEGR